MDREKHQIMDDAGVQSFRVNISAQALLQGIYARKWLAIGLFIFTLLGVILYAMTQPDVYVASAKLLIKKGRAESIVSPAPNVKAVYQLDVNEQALNSEIEILLSTTLLQEVAAATGLYKRYKIDSSLSDKDAIDLAAARLKRDLTIHVVPSSNVIKVKYESENPYFAARVVNELCRLYVDRHLAIHDNTAAFAFFASQAEALRDTLYFLKSKLQEFAATSGYVDPQRQRELALERLAAAEKERETATTDIREARQQVEFLESKLASEPELIQKQTQRIYDAVVQSMQRELDSLQAEYEQRGNQADLLQSRSAIDSLILHPNSAREFKMKIAKVEEAILSEKSPSPQAIANDINRSVRILRDEMIATRLRLAGLEARRSALTHIIGSLRNELVKLELAALQYETLRRKRDLVLTNYQLYVQKQEESRISRALDKERVANVSVIDKASVPLKPARPNRKLSILLGMVLAVFVSLGSVSLLAYMNEMQRTSPGKNSRLNSTNAMLSRDPRRTAAEL